MAEIVLRPMQPSDSPGLDTLLRNEPQTTRFSMSTRYLHDVYRSLLALHPTQYGVVAELPGDDGLVGMATAFTDEIRVAGRVLPAAHLENLKVRSDRRRQGLGGRLAAWRIAEADRRFAGEGIITTAIEISNAGSLATARQWATQILGPVRIMIGGPAKRRPSSPDLDVRPVEARDLEAVAAGTDAFYADFELARPATAESIAASLAPTELGFPIHQYRVVVGRDGAILAGAGITDRFALMIDHIDRIPAILVIVGRLSGTLGADRTIRSAELSGVWHRPGRVDAARFLWDAIRHEWRDRATSIVGIADPRSTLVEAFHVGRAPGPRLQLMAPVRSPMPLDLDRPVALTR